MHQEDGVVDDDPDEDDEAQHGQHVERLVHVEIEKCQTGDAARRGDGHRQENDQRVNEALEQDRHDEIDDDERQQQVEGEGIAGFDQVVGGSADAELDSRRQPLVHQRLHHPLANRVESRFQRDALVRPDLERYGAEALTVTDLGGGARRQFHTGQRACWKNAPGGGHDGQRADALCLRHPRLRSPQGQVYELTADGHLDHPQTVVERVHRHRQLLCCDAVVRQPDAIRDHSNLRRSQFEPGIGAPLVALTLGKGLQDLEEGPIGDLQNLVELRTAHVQLDLAPAADAAPEDGRLGDEAECAGLAERRFAQHGLELTRALGLDRHGTQKSAGPGRDKEEALDLGRFPRGGLRSRHRCPVGLDLRFDRLGDFRRGIEVVAGRRDDDAEQQVAVALGQILELRQHEPGARRGRHGHERDDCEGERALAYDAGGEAGGEADEAAGETVDARQAHADDTGFAGAAAETEQAFGQGRDDGGGNDEREHDRNGYGDSDVTEELAGFELHHQYGDEHHHRGQRRDQHRPPDLVGALVGGVLR